MIFVNLIFIYFYKLYTIIKSIIKIKLYTMRILRNITAFISIPAIIAAGYTLLKVFLSFAGTGGKEYMPFWIGILFYIVFQVAFYKPMRTYVFGHELSHALAGILSGAKIKKFKVGKNSGSVVLNKDNIWITLAPYFFPIYTFIIIVIYLLMGWFINIRELYSYFLFFIGVSIAFHIALTVYILKIEQPDIKVYGKFFSYTMIFAINIIVFSLLMLLAFPYEINANVYFMEMKENIVQIYIFIYTSISMIIKAFKETA